MNKFFYKVFMAAISFVIGEEFARAYFNGTFDFNAMVLLFIFVIFLILTFFKI